MVGWSPVLWRVSLVSRCTSVARQTKKQEKKSKLNCYLLENSVRTWLSKCREKSDEGPQHSVRFIALSSNANPNSDQAQILTNDWGHL